MLFAHALRDLRGSMRQFRLFFLCLALGVMVMACVGSLVAGVKAGIDRDAKSLLGGDVEIRQLYTPLADTMQAWLQFHAVSMSRVSDMRAMAEAGNERALIELKAIDAEYPLYGTLEYAQARSDKPVLFNEGWRKFYGAAVDQSLMDALNLKLKDKFSVGNVTYVVGAVLANEPDRSVSGLTLGPRVLVSREALHATGLVTYGTLINYRYRVKLPPGTDLAQWKQQLASAFSKEDQATPGRMAQWNMRDWREAAPGLVTMIDRLSLFFALTGITTLMVAGLGISNATQVYVWSKRQTIATLKCLGASEHYIRHMYLLQLLMMGGMAILCGCAMGALASSIIMYWFGDMLPVRGEGGIYLLPLLYAALLGVLTVLLFSLLPLIQASGIKPAALFRGYSDWLPRSKALHSWRVGMAYVALMLLMLITAVLFTGTLRIPLYFSVGLAVAMAMFVAIAAMVKKAALAAAHGKRRSISWSFALSNLARPGAATTSIVVALGIGMCLLVALSLVGGNLRRQIQEGLPAHAPAFFLVDIQPSERADLLARLKQLPDISHVTDLPMVRGRIIKVNGIPADEVSIEENARWALRGERGLTYAAVAPERASIVAGAWWPADYHGLPLVSFDASLAKGMGLKLGDTITIAALDKEITATISNLRDIRWGSLEMNFAIILSPGALDGLPATYLATVSVPKSGEKQVQAMMREYHPTVAVVRVRDVLDKINTILRNMSRAVLITAAITIICGIVVMASAVHASLQKRTLDTVILKVLGVTRRRILSIYLMEFSAISFSVAFMALLIGTIAAWGIMQLMIFSEFVLLPSVMISTLIGGLVLSILLGLAATRFALRVRPLALLRNE